MRSRRKGPIAGIPFGWEQVSEKLPIGFASLPPRPQADAPAMVIDASEAHALVIAETGGGKGRNFLIPTLLASGNSAVVVDPKGEAAMVTARYRRSIGQEVFILDPFHVLSDRTDTFNPLDLVAREADARVEDAAEAATTIVGDRSTREPFWDNWAVSLIGAMISAVITIDPDANLGRVWKNFHSDDTIYNVAVMLDTVGSKLDEVAQGHLAAFLQLPEKETRPSVLGTVQQHIRLFGNPLVKAAMGTTSFDLAALRDGRPLTIYLVVPPNKIRSHAPMLRLWLWGILTAMVKRPTNPVLPTLFLIDEFAHIGAFPLLEDCVTLMRGYGVRLVLFLQHVEQLAKLYPRSVNTIVGNCAAVAAFGISNAAMAKPIAELLGDITPEQLIGMAPGELALRLRKQPTRMITKLDYLTDRQFRGRFDRNERYRGSR